MVVYDEETYIKGKPPKKAELKVKFELLNILEIGEIEMNFRTQFKLYMEWYDARLSFLNLHNRKVANRLVMTDQKKIWIPTMIFENTDKKLRTIADSESIIYVNRTGLFKRSSKDHVDNEYIFEGKFNKISKTFRSLEEVVWFIQLTEQAKLRLRKLKFEGNKTGLL